MRTCGKRGDVQARAEKDSAKEQKADQRNADINYLVYNCGHTLLVVDFILRPIVVLRRLFMTGAASKQNDIAKIDEHWGPARKRHHVAATVRGTVCLTILTGDFAGPITNACVRALVKSARVTNQGARQR